MKRITALLLALLLGLTACGKGGGTDGEKLAFRTAPAYITEECPLPVTEGRLHGSYTDGTYLYYLITGEDAEQPTLSPCSMRSTRTVISRSGTTARECWNQG